MVEEMNSDWQEQLEAHRAKTRGKIMGAALELVSQHGVAGTTMSKVAERAAISRATLYKYFPDVPQVLMAWVLEEVSRGVDHLEAGLADLLEPIAKLEFFVTELLRTWAGAEHRFGVEQLAADLPRDDLEQMEVQMRRLRCLLAELLTEGVREGSFRRELDPEFQADVLLHMIVGLRTLVLREDSSEDDVAASVSGILLSGLTAD